MPNYPAAYAQRDFDTLAYMYDLLAAALGTGTTADTVSRGAVNIRDRVTAALDSIQAASIHRNLVGAALALVSRCKIVPDSDPTQPYPAVTLFSEYLQGLQAELGAIDTYLTSQSMRVHPSFATLYNQWRSLSLSPANVFPLVTEMGRIDRGASSFTFTDGSAIDEDLYGPAQLEIYVPEGYTIGVADVVVTLTCKLFGGGTEPKTATMPSGSMAGTAVNVGTSANRYTDVTNMTATGGTSGDRVAVRSKLLRDITTTAQIVPSPSPSLSPSASASVSPSASPSD